MNTVLAAGDISGQVTSAVSGLSGELTTVGAIAIGVGVVIYGSKLVWRFFKGLAH